MFLKVQQGKISHTTPVLDWISVSLDSGSLTQPPCLYLCRLKTPIRLLRKRGWGRRCCKGRQRGWRRSTLSWWRGNRGCSIKCTNTLCIWTSWSGWSSWLRCWMEKNFTFTLTSKFVYRTGTYDHTFTKPTVCWKPFETHSTTSTAVVPILFQITHLFAALKCFVIEKLHWGCKAHFDPWEVLVISHPKSGLILSLVLCLFLSAGSCFISEKCNNLTATRRGGLCFWATLLMCVCYSLKMCNPSWII